VLAENLVVLGITGAVPLQAITSHKQPCAAALASALGHAAVEPTNPGFGMQGTSLDELDTAPVMDGFAVAKVGGACLLVDPFQAYQVGKQSLSDRHDPVANCNTTEVPSAVVDSISRRPRCCDTISRAIASPRPLPVELGPLTKRSKT
jgi:hypothetical protein